MLAAGLVHLRRLPGRRCGPAIAVPIPTRNGRSLLIDAGANAEAAPSTCSSSASWARCSRPRSSGSPDPQRAPALERRASPRRAIRSGSRRTSCSPQLRAPLRRQHRGAATSCAARPTSSSRDGFTGNVALKLLEGTIKELLDLLRERDRRASARGKLGGLLIRPAARRLRARLDPDTYGGAYLLGLRGLAVIAHGNSGREAIANAIALAARGAEHRVVERLAERLPERERRPAPASELQGA